MSEDVGTHLEQPAEAAAPAPRWDPAAVPARLSRRGIYWVPGSRVSSAEGTLPCGPLFVEWEAPEHITEPYPLVLIHGGGGQGTDWLGTPDGGAGWASRFVDTGFAVHVADRPGHGRSPLHPDVLGAPGPAFTYEGAVGLFAPAEVADRQTAWPGGRDAGDPVVEQLVAPTGPMLADVPAAHAREGEALTRLLEAVGPAVLVTHSAGAPAGWMVADRRPDLVRAIVAIEPIGPPFASIRGGGHSLAYGLTAAPTGYRAPTQDEPATWPALADVPVAVVTAEVSPLAGIGRAVMDHLAGAGVDVEHLDLPAYGIRGNGHGVMMESNGAESVALLAGWIRGVVTRSPRT
ncbi:alpha/beta fold hydrolase [Pseudonocardia lutea]|uniref:Alpha/beta fold hydrolase n=1 Tax=Pseudonocardia lutea TaxID=2172015 RepID=A0ABW1IG71_9PSEU